MLDLETLAVANTVLYSSLSKDLASGKMKFLTSVYCILVLVHLGLIFSSRLLLFSPNEKTVKGKNENRCLVRHLIFEGESVSSC